MGNDLIAKIERAIESSRSWASVGWEMRWGMRQEPVSSLPAALSEPETSVHRYEALNYWRDVEEMGAECAEYGLKALEAARAGEMEKVVDALYYAKYVEKRINKQTPTWGDSYEAARSSLAS